MMGSLERVVTAGEVRSVLPRSEGSYGDVRSTLPRSEASSGSGEGAGSPVIGKSISPRCCLSVNALWANDGWPLHLPCKMLAMSVRGEDALGPPRMSLLSTKAGCQNVCGLVWSATTVLHAKGLLRQSNTAALACSALRDALMRQACCKAESLAVTSLQMYCQQATATCMSLQKLQSVLP